jgi:hypothetical protein
MLVWTCGLFPAKVMAQYTYISTLQISTERLAVSAVIGQCVQMAHLGAVKLLPKLRVATA